MTRRQVSVALLTLALVLTFQDSRPCAGAGDQAQDGPEGKIIVKDWKDIDEAGSISQRCDSVNPALAAEAERGFLLRINGQAPDLFDASHFRKLRTPLYVIADRRFNLPSGPPQFRFIDGLSQLKDQTKREKLNSDYVTMKVEGCSRGPTGEAGVVISYAYGDLDWEWLVWDALSEEEKRLHEKPRYLALFGGWCRVLVVREGDDLVFYQGQMVVY